MSRKSKGAPHSLVAHADDLIEDSALDVVSDDRFSHTAMATAVADLLVATNRPTNVALFGPWGSGKSSFRALLEARIGVTDPKARVVRYDAWRFGGKALKRQFITDIGNQLGLNKNDELTHLLTQNKESSRLRLRSWLWLNRWSLSGAVLVAFGVAIAWIALRALLVCTYLTPKLEWGEALRQVAPEGGPVMGIVLAGLVIGPKAMEAAVVKTTQAAPESDEQFTAAFEQLVKNAKKEGVDRLIVFIDELDRCSPHEVVATLIDLKTFLDDKECTFIVAVDREVLEAALQQVPQAKPIRGEQPYYSTPGAFIDKVFQHQLSIPPLRPTALSTFAMRLVKARGGVWEDIRSLDPEDTDRIFNETIYCLIPGHVRSPRRVKVLLNNYATNIRVAEQRGIDLKQRTQELAVLTVLQTEFPAVAAAMLRIPQLLQRLREHEALSKLGEDDQRLLDSFTVPDKSSSLDDETDVDGAAGRLLAPPNANREDLLEANLRLNRQLRDYLGKLDNVGSGGVNDPRPDLLYMQSAGFDEGLTDPLLGEVIDLAADLTASTVVSRFQGEPSSVIAAGVRLLAAQIDVHEGVARDVVLEAACQLIELLNPRDVRENAPNVGPRILAHFRDAVVPTNAIPGAFILATINGAKEVAEELLDEVDFADDENNDLLDRLVAALPMANPAIARSVHAALASAFRDNQKVLERAITTLPSREAMEMWSAVRPAVVAVLGPPAEPDEVQPETLDSDVISERALELLAAVETRTPFDRELFSDVLLTVQGLDAPDIAASIRSRSDEFIAYLGSWPTQINRHAAMAIARGPIDDWTYWSDRIDDAKGAAEGPEPELALEEILANLSDASPDQVEVILRTFTLLHPILPNNFDASESIRTALDVTDWQTDPSGVRHAAIHHIAQQLVTPENEMRINETIAADLTNSFSTSVHDDALVSLWIRAISDIGELAAKQIDRILNDETPGSGEEIAHLRVRIAARRNFGGEALPVHELIALSAEPLISQAAGEWLALTPSVEDVQSFMSHAAIGSDRLGAYADRLDSEERSALWIHAMTLGLPEKHTEAIGRKGLGAAAIEHVHDAVLKEPRQPDRDSLIRRLLASPLVEEPAHKQATELAGALVQTDQQGDDYLAACVIVHSGGFTTGHTGRMRKAFNTYIRKRHQRLNQQQIKKLSELDLIQPPRKSRVGRMLAALKERS